MTHIFDTNGNLVLELDAKDKAFFKKAEESNPVMFDSDEVLYRLMEDFVDDNLLCWVRPEEIGALTDAPLLGRKESGYGSRITDVWGWMNYQIESLQRYLLNTGKATLMKG